MSRVTNYLLMFSFLEEGTLDTGATVVDLNRRLAGAKGPYTQFRPLHEHAGGPKRMVTDVYGLAGNYFPPHAMMQFIAQCAWQEPASVQLLYKDHEETVWTMLSWSDIARAGAG